MSGAYRERPVEQDRKARCEGLVLGETRLCERVADAPETVMALRRPHSNSSELNAVFCSRADVVSDLIYFSITHLLLQQAHQG